MLRILVATSLTLALLSLPPLAQESANFTLTEHVFNAGGNPANGTELTSASFRVTLDALGESVGTLDLSSASFNMAAGFVAPYPPPIEVSGLFFSDPQTLQWDAQLAGFYDLYRDDAGDGYGVCQQDQLTAPMATDPATPSPGAAFFYLVTANNNLEEGTKGFRSDDTQREGATNLPVCP